MSNTEDTQRIEGLNPGDKAYILTEEQYIKFEKQNDVIADLKFKLKNDAIFQEYSDLEKELASLREQLKEREQQLNASLRNTTRLLDRLKQQEEVIRKLIPLARMFVVHKEWMGEECKTEKAIIEKAKSLTTKDKWNQ